MLAKLEIIDESITETCSNTTENITVTALLNDKRRNFQLKYNFCYERLTLAQKYSAAELFQYGYLLKFIRGKGVTSFAIFINEGKVATVDYSGEIELNPNIKVRR